MAIAAHVAPIVIATPEVPRSIGNDRDHTALLQPTPQRVAVIPAVSNQPVRILARATTAAPWHADRVQRRIDERDFRRTGRADMNSERNTLAVDHHHPLRTLAAGGFSDVGAPFFADANDPS